MRYIKGLTKDTIKLLKRIYKQSKYYQVRQRSHCILLSYEKYRISELIEIFKVSRNTIYNWFNNWETLGLLNKNNQLESYIFQCKINSEIVIKFLDRYVKKIDKLTVVVIDNAPIHRSKAFQSKIAEWKQKKLEIFWLPTYSPQLNLIEILWRFMKYEWIETEAYSSWKNLVEYVEKVLKNFGTKYTINFA